jgi:hypothetical protein
MELLEAEVVVKNSARTRVIKFEGTRSHHHQGEMWNKPISHQSEKKVMSKVTGRVRRRRYSRISGWEKRTQGDSRISRRSWGPKDCPEKRFLMLNKESG